jgi:hypothetical protein
MIGYRTHWYGKEVEGRFTDIETLFIADIKALDKIVQGKIAHVYFCSGATAQLIEHDKWDMVFRMISDTSFVTIEVTPGMLEKIPPMIRIRAHILLMLDCKDAELLKKTDSIKVVYADYSLYCTTVHNMQQVTPDDYKFDRQ